MASQAFISKLTAIVYVLQYVKLSIVNRMYNEEKGNDYIRA